MCQLWVARREAISTHTCNKCKLVKYCDPVCKKKHRSKHKKKCEKRVAEMHDESFFKQPPQLEECPICFSRLPSVVHTGSKFKVCCGKVICSGCIHAPVYVIMVTRLNSTGMLWKSYLQWMHYGNKVEKEMRLLQNSNSLPAHTRRLSILR